MSGEPMTTPTELSTTQIAAGLDHTDHQLARKGCEMRVRVRELPGGHVLIFGQIADGCLVRIHARCFYGDLLRSDDCDCRARLDKALDMIQEEGSGVLVYLDQYGWNAGLKAHRYRESELSGTGTPPSYETLAAASLYQLGLRSVRLITDQPDRVAALCAVGITVEVQSLQIAAAPDITEEPTP